MRAILISIRPQYVAKILNGKKTIEIRKKFPKDYVGWVYIYCTKGGALLFKEHSTNTYLAEEENKNYRPHYALNGTVVAKFTLNKVDKIHLRFEKYCAGELSQDGLCKYACLSLEELDNYLYGENGYAIHITNLEIFDKPKEMGEFKSKLHIRGGCKNCPQYTGFSMPYCATCDFFLPITHAPQSWCYVEAL